MAAAAVIPAGWALAVGMEFLQLFFPPRTVSLNDVLVECLGVVLGAGAWLTAGPWFTDWLRRFWDRRGVAGLAAQVFPAYVGLLLVIYLMPFDFVLGGQELIEKYRQGQIQLVPFGDLASGRFGSLVPLALNFLSLVPVVALLALTPRGSRLRGWQVLGVGLVVTVPLRLAQLLVNSRHFDVTNLLTGVAAILLGWWLVHGRAASELRETGAAWCRRVSHWGPAPWLGLAALWALLLALVYWQPFHFTVDPSAFDQAGADWTDEDTGLWGLRRFSWAPFVDYYWGSRYQALDQLLWRTLAFAPLGMLLAPAWGDRARRGAWTTVLAALVVSVLLGLGQYFIPERHPSTTSVLIQLGAAWLGYQLARHAMEVLQPGGEGGGPGQTGAAPRQSDRPAAYRARQPGGSPFVQSRAAGGVRKEWVTLADWLATQPAWVALPLLCLAVVVVALGFVWLVGTWLLAESGP
jgi:glycopeptide antibiotics resistance protein